jgi:hypothetical protein
MQDRSIKKIVWLVYAIPAIPLLIYTSANLTTGSWRIVICSFMFVVLAGLLWFTNYVVSQLRHGRLFANSRGGLTYEVTDSVEITDSAADDFLRAMGAAAEGQSRKQF